MFAGCSDMPAAVSLPGSDRANVASTPPRDIGLGGAWDRSLIGLRAQDQRVANVAYRIATANRVLCSDQALLTGLVLQSALQYSPRLRPAAMATFHIDDRPAVEAVAAQSPAAAAGLQPDDILLAVDDQPLATRPSGADAPDTRPATYAPVEAAQARIADALRTGVAAVTVARGPTVLRLALGGQARLRLRRTGAARARVQRLGGWPARIHLDGVRQLRTVGRHAGVGVGP